jgi:hypothetical protein
MWKRFKFIVERDKMIYLKYRLGRLKYINEEPTTSYWRSSRNLVVDTGAAVGFDVLNYVRPWSTLRDWTLLQIRLWMYENTREYSERTYLKCSSWLGTLRMSGFVCRWKRHTKSSRPFAYLLSLPFVHFIVKIAHDSTHAWVRLTPIHRLILTANGS